MERKERELYDAPTVMVVEVHQEGVICTSTEMQDYDWNEYFEE